MTVRNFENKSSKRRTFRKCTVKIRNHCLHFINSPSVTKSSAPLHVVVVAQWAKVTFDCVMYLHSYPERSRCRPNQWCWCLW